MREFNLGPIGSDKKLKKQQKVRRDKDYFCCLIVTLLPPQAIYSTSETEEEYQAYMKAKPKWHGKGGHKDSWDPLQIASPPQIVQRPVGVVQKPKPQAKVPQKIERGAQVYPASLQIYPGPQGTNGQGLNGGQQEEAPSAFSVPKNYERIQKSDSIIEMKMVGSERIQKSTSVVEVVPSRQIKKDASPNPQALPLPSMKELSPIQQSKKEPSPFQQASLQPMKESSPYQQQPTSPPSLATKELSPSVSKPVPVLSSLPSSTSLPTNMDSYHRVASPPTLDSLQVPTSPQDSEDQSTPQAPRKFYMAKQTSVDSTNSFSENDEHENPALKSIREDPETTKKKEIHKNLMSEALQKVELRKKNPNFSQMARTNPTLASLNIATRKELKIEEMEAKMEQDDSRGRHKSGSYGDLEPTAAASSAVSSSVNNNVLDTFRAQSIHKGGTSGQNGASRQAAIAAKKAGTPKKAMTPVKPDILPKPVTSLEPRVDVSEPVVILRKQPRILEPSEIKARVEEQSKGRLLSPLPHPEASKPRSFSHTVPHTHTPHLSSRKTSSKASFSLVLLSYYPP